jgi:hypothetical protein
MSNATNDNEWQYPKSRKLKKSNNNRNNNNANHTNESLLQIRIQQLNELSTQYNQINDEYKVNIIASLHNYINELSNDLNPINKLNNELLQYIMKDLQTNICLDIVSYGIGSYTKFLQPKLISTITSNNNNYTASPISISNPMVSTSMIQFATILQLQNKLTAQINSNNTKDSMKVNHYIYDPLCTTLDLSLSNSYNLQSILTNECGYRKIIDKNPTIFYMIHCGELLYNNLLQANWDHYNIQYCIIIGNSFTNYTNKYYENYCLKKNQQLNNNRGKKNKNKDIASTNAENKYYCPIHCNAPILDPTSDNGNTNDSCCSHHFKCDYPFLCLVRCLDLLRENQLLIETNTSNNKSNSNLDQQFELAFNNTSIHYFIKQSNELDHSNKWMNLSAEQIIKATNIATGDSTTVVKDNHSVHNYDPEIIMQDISLPLATNDKSTIN